MAPRLVNVASKDMRRTQNLNVTTSWNKTTCWKKTKECSLLKLAPELRNHIWHLMGQIYKTAEGAIEIGNKTAECPAILLTCKQIREEMLKMYHHDDSHEYTDGGEVSSPAADVPLTKWLQRKHDKGASIKQLTLCFEGLPLGSIPDFFHGLELLKEPCPVEMRNPVAERHDAARCAARRILNIVLRAEVRIEKLVIKGPEWIYGPQWYRTMNFGRWWTRAMLQRAAHIRNFHGKTLIGSFDYHPTISEAI